LHFQLNSPIFKGVLGVLGLGFGRIGLVKPPTLAVQRQAQNSEFEFAIDVIYTDYLIYLLFTSYLLHTYLLLGVLGLGFSVIGLVKSTNPITPNSNPETKTPFSLLFGFEFNNYYSSPY
jgi:hypothetical protein